MSIVKQKKQMDPFFYKDGVLFKVFSTLDIAQDKKNISCTVPHYRISKIQKLDGKYSAVQRIDGGWIKFDITSGEMVSSDHLAMDSISKMRRSYDVNFRLQAWLRLLTIF